MKFRRAREKIDDKCERGADEASFFVWKKRDFIQILCSGIVNFSSLVPLWIIFSILGAVQHAVEGYFFQNYAGDQKRKKRKNMQPGIVAAGERILSFISSFPCFFRKKKIFFLKKAAINTYIKNKKIKNT